ncbi:hypothetical protein FHR81_002814 [Actinoalloteichus hoggarensis]|uniref:Uncharacterized protein n=1 Tax=Actinoalloteichus hoggarensis TaxID=1470176 RepID=A0A221VXX7_9PSEU|nr:hypothetical protein AHOG_03770 [Actinoalloteichus hoggarensis]MBB5921774.1 hypothetical protein [Actinoalloteichus hoggarensis]
MIAPRHTRTTRITALLPAQAARVRPYILAITEGAR